MPAWLKRFWAWLLLDVLGPPEGLRVVARVYVRPVVVNPKTGQEVEFAKWRVGHINRWLEDAGNSDHDNRQYLTDERDMHVEALRAIGIEL